MIVKNHQAEAGRYYLYKRINITSLFTRICVGFTFPLSWDVNILAIGVTSYLGIRQFVASYDASEHEKSRIPRYDVTHWTRRFYP